MRWRTLTRVYRFDTWFGLGTQAEARPVIDVAPAIQRLTMRMEFAYVGKVDRFPDLVRD